MMFGYRFAQRHIGTQLRYNVRSRSFKFAGQPAFAKTFLTGYRIDLSTQFGRLHDGLESGALASGAFEFLAKLG
jgi:hypothetical protein